MRISKDKIGVIEYTLTNAEGEVLDTSEGREPLAYLHGHGTIISGLEDALEGKTVGDTFRVSIPPAEAYGERDEELVQEVPLSAFEGSGMGDVEPGMQFQAKTEAGMRILTVVAVEGDTVHVDGNHELAGETLTFDVAVKEVRDASKDELKHGHAHGPGGHHHH